MSVSGWIMVVLAVLAMPTAQAAETPYTFNKAKARGAVYLAPSHIQGESDDLIAHLRELDPGIIADFAYFWGGPTQARVESATSIATKVHQQAPKALLVSALSEGVRPNYSEMLHCGGTLGDRHFTADAITSHRRQSQTSLWVDLAKLDAAAFYTCVAESYINDGFAITCFEAPVLVLRNSSDPAAAAMTYEAIRAALIRYDVP
jgi:hypothetical protein